MRYNQLTTEQYIERARTIHGDTFDYSDTVYTSMDKKIVIRCKKHGIFECYAGNHVNRKVMSGCPYCAKKLVYKGETDLQSQYPEIAKYFDEEKNGIHTDEVFAHSNKKYWWKCDKCGKSYQSPINIHIRGHKCPYCAGLKVLSGKNDLATLFPDIAAEYSDDNELPANKISAQTHKKVKWVCSHCNQEYLASPHHRTSNDKTGCPYCKRQSKGERKVKKILKKYNITYKEQEWFDDLRSEAGRPLRYDFTIYKDNIWIGTIEFNGEQHYKPISVFGGKEQFDVQKQHDFQKEIYSLEHDVPILIIPYKSSEGSVEYLITRFLYNLHLVKEIVE